MRIPQPFISRTVRSLLFRIGVAMLLVLAWSGLAFCGEIHDAAKKGDLDKVKSLLKANPDLVFNKDDNDDGLTPLHMAAIAGYKEVAELLLASKADVNAKGKNGWTPLHAAELMGHEDVAELLRQHGGKK